MADENESPAMEGSHAVNFDVTVAASDSAPSVSFETLVEREQRRIAALVRRLLAWERDVDDVVQDVFVAALRGWDGFRGASKPETWLTAIAIRVCRSRARRAALLKRFRWWATEATATHAGKRSEAAEEAEQVRRVLQELPMREREALVLLHLEGMTANEAAELLGVSRGALETRASRARQTLRVRLGGDGERS